MERITKNIIQKTCLEVIAKEMGLKSNDLNPEMDLRDDLDIVSLDAMNIIMTLEDKGVKVFVDAGAVMYLLGTEMDYKKEELSSSFVFKNPNETERCGCGESFKI